MKNKHRLFSKALFKQSCKANGIMWLIITAAVCFMLACVMLISGTSNISQVKDGVEDTIIQELIKSEIKKSSVNLYDTTNEGEYTFDIAFANKFDEINTKENYQKYQEEKLLATASVTSLITSSVTEKVTEEVTNRLTQEIEAKVQSEENEIKEEITQNVTNDMQTLEAQEKVLAKVSEGNSLDEAKALVIAEYTEIETKNVTEEHINNAKASILTDAHKNEVKNTVLAENKEKYTNEAKALYKDELDIATKNCEEIFKEMYIVPSYEAAVDAVKAKYPEDTNKQAYNASMVAINPSNKADNVYEENNEIVPEEYIINLLPYIQNDVESNFSSKTNTLIEYIESTERDSFRNTRAYNAISMLVANKLSDKEYKKTILDILKDYNVTEEKYDTMGFDYKNVKSIAYEASLEYQEKYNYELSLVKADANLEKEKERIHDEVYLSVAGSLLDKLPKNVSDGIEELGTMDLYGLIVGSIFFKMAGLLLPIIYVIMCSNNLIASQVDTGSMAYVLSTSTRRKEVTFTQAVYLIASIFLMFVATTITSCICFKIANVTTNLTYLKLILINLGAFISLFAISGINFFTSSIFDRSKKAMALGGGISMFFLVATMLGLFGSPVIPSVVRISALNNFNYVSLITLFDVVSILNGEVAWVWKLAILVVIGLAGYISGSIYFRKKDLPL